MNKTTLVITRPNHDVTTNYLYHWSRFIISAAEHKGTYVVDLKATDANKKKFRGVMKKVRPHLVVLNGHGNSTEVTGFNNETLVASTDTENILEGTITYARSCQSGHLLGNKVVKNGTRAYIGYQKDFVFLSNDENLTTPLKDKTAALFLEPSNQVMLSLLKGHTAAESYQKSQHALKNNIQKLLTSEARENQEMLPFLSWNLRNQVCLGDPEAKIE